MKSIDASGCADYEALLALRSAYPALDLTAFVTVGGKAVPMDAQRAVLRADTPLPELLEMLPFLPELYRVSFTGGAVSYEMQDALTAAFPSLSFRWDVEVLGVTASSAAKELSFAGQTLTAQDVDTLCDNLFRFPALERIDLTGCGLTPEQIRSVGVGVPGAVEIHSGAVLYTCNLPLRNVPLRKLFHRYLPYPLYVQNDANCAALAEYYAGAGKGSKRFVTITLGTGVGACILHNGQIYHGANGMAGEVGHMSIVYHGEPCPCGRRGCWERYASASALKRLTARAMEDHPGSILCRVVAENNGKVSGQSAFIAAREGDPVGQSVCDEYIGYLAAGVTNVVNIFQPDTLAIGGGVSNESDEQLLLPLQRLVEQESIPCNRDKRTRIVKAQLGNNAGIIGAALLGKRKLRK